MVVDDEPSTLSVLSDLLKAKGHEVSPALGPEKARALLTSQAFDLMISDIRMTPVNGMDLLRLARKERPAMSVLMLTAYGSVETAIEAMRIGAFDYIPKPFKVDELLATVDKALEFHEVVAENQKLKEDLSTRYALGNIVAVSESMKKVCDMIRRVAPTDTTVLIGGESGTGKEVVAKALHANSRRKKERFLDVNCAALPEPLLESEMFGHIKGAFTGASANKEGLFEAAHGGTIFLDEIGSAPLSIQGKLLRVLQEREIRRVGSNDNIPIDVRVIAATNSPLRALMDKGEFREDLYYRLSVITIEIDPLRKRQEDILPLADHFLRAETPEGKTLPVLDQEAAALLENYSWPGNVRELESAIKHAKTFVTGDRITKDVLPPRIVATAGTMAAASGQPERLDASRCKSLKAFLRNREMEYLQQVLELTGGNKEEAAKALKISLATLYRKLPEAVE